jgi:hypothetical protein
MTQNGHGVTKLLLSLIQSIARMAATYSTQFPFMEPEISSPQKPILIQFSHNTVCKISFNIRLPCISQASQVFFPMRLSK